MTTHTREQDCFWTLSWGQMSGKQLGRPRGYGPNKRSESSLGTYPSREQGFFLALLLSLALGGCKAPGLSEGPLDNEKAGETRQPESDLVDGGLPDNDEILIADPADPDPIENTPTCEQDSSCPSNRLFAWELWTARSIYEGDAVVDTLYQSSYFSQSEIYLGSSNQYDLSRIKDIYVDRVSMQAFLVVDGLPEKLMPLRNTVMQGQSVWELGRFVVSINQVNSWWLTMRNSRWENPTLAAVDICLHSSQTNCTTLYKEVSGDFVL